MTAEDHARLKNLLDRLDNLGLRQDAAAIRALATDRDELADKTDRLLEHLIGINNALGGDRVCDGEDEVRDQAWRLAKIDELRADVARLTERIYEDNAVCLCGCPTSEHEQYDEGGESCENETHVCLRVPKAVAAEFGEANAKINALKAEVIQGKREGFVAGYGEGTGHGNRVSLVGGRLQAELDGRYPVQP